MLICPAGQVLERQATACKHGLQKAVYEASAAACVCCAQRDACCGRAVVQRGRRVDRVLESEAMQAYLERMASEPGLQCYRERSRYGEFAQLQIKAVLGLRRFHVRGLEKVRQEGRLWAMAYNILQWIRLGWSKGAGADGKGLPAIV